MPSRKLKIASEPALKRSAVRKKKEMAAPETVAPATSAAPAAAAVAVVPPSPAAVTKMQRVIALLSRAEGATITQMAELTGWKARSVRGFMAGALKAKRVIVITSTKSDGVRTYRIEAPAP